MTVDPRCDSHSLTLERHSISEWKQIQFVSCETCGSEWRETWILPNWFWLKTSFSDNHWISQGRIGNNNPF
jgi:hypothetical protein